MCNLGVCYAARTACVLGGRWSFMLPQPGGLVLKRFFLGGLSGVQPTGPVLYKMGWGSDGGESNAVTGIRPHKPLPKPEHL